MLPLKNLKSAQNDLSQPHQNQPAQHKSPIVGIALTVLGITGIGLSYYAYRNFDSIKASFPFLSSKNPPDNDPTKQTSGNSLDSSGKNSFDTTPPQQGDIQAIGESKFTIQEEIASNICEGSNFKIPDWYYSFPYNPFATHDCNTIYLADFEFPCYKEAEKITLKDFKAMTEEKRMQNIDKFGLQKSIDLLGGDDFRNALENANEDALKLGSLVDLRMYAEDPDTDRIRNITKLKYILMPDSRFKELTLREVISDHSEPKCVITERLSKFPVKPIPNLPNNLLDMSLVDFASLTIKDIKQNAGKIQEEKFLPIIIKFSEELQSVRDTAK